MRLYSLRFFQKNLRGSLKCVDALFGDGSLNSYDVILLQDPPSYFVTRRGKTFMKWDIVGAIGDKANIKSVILIKKELVYTKYVTVGGRTTGVCIKSTGRTLGVFSSYLQPGSMEGFDEMKGWLQKSISENIQTVLGCDCNSHNTLWGGNKTDTQGTILQETINELGMSFINLQDSIPTYESSTGACSWIDITAAAGPMDIFDWKVIEDKDGFSDHNTIIFKMLWQLEKRERIIKDWKNCEWGKVNNFLVEEERGLQSLQGLSTNNNSMTDLEFYTNKFMEIVQESIRDAVPEKTIGFEKKRWWSLKISELRKKHRRLYNKVKRKRKRGIVIPGDLLVEVVAAKRDLQSEIAAGKKATWEETIDSLSAVDPWKVYNKLCKPKQSIDKDYVIDAVGTVHTNNQDIAKVMLDKFYPPVESEQWTAEQSP